MDEVELTRKVLRIPLFEDLGADLASRLVKTATHRDVAVGEVLCEPDTVDESLLIVVEGVLGLESQDGTELAEITPPRLLGEMGVLTQLPRSTRVVCREAASVLELNRGTLEDLLEADPDLEHHLLIGLLRLLYDRIHGMNDDMEAVRRRADELERRLQEVAPGHPLLSGGGAAG